MLGWKMSSVPVPFQMMLNLWFFSYYCFIYCNCNLLPAPEAYTTVQSLIIPIWRKVLMNQLFTRLNIKMAQNKIFAAFTDVKDSVVAQQPGEKKQRTLLFSSGWEHLCFIATSSSPKWKTTFTNLGFSQMTTSISFQRADLHRRQTSLPKRSLCHRSTCTNC